MKINPLAPKEILALQRKWRLFTPLVIAGYALGGVYVIVAGIVGFGGLTGGVVVLGGLSMPFALGATARFVIESGVVTRTTTPCANPECTDSVLWDIGQGTWVHRGTNKKNCRNV